MKKLLMFVFVASVVASAFSANDVVDSRIRTLIHPSRVVWKTQHGVCGEENLLGQKTGQVPENCWISSTGCTLENKDSPSAILLDFGREIHGGIHLTHSGRSDGLQVRIRFGESVSETMCELGEKGSTNDHSLRDGVYTVPHFGSLEIGNTGFRFVRIDLVSKGTLPIDSVLAISLMRDMKRMGEFKSSDERLNRIWETAVQTVHLCCQEFVWDGIKRDRLVWAGDMHPEASTILSVFGAEPVLTSTLDYIARITPPKSSWMNGIPNYTLWYLRYFYSCYLYTGDKEFVKMREKYLRDTVDHVFSYVENMGGGWRFLDWPTEHNKKAVDSGTRALMALALDDAAKLMNVVGDETRVNRCRDLAKKIRTEKHETFGAKSAAALLALSGLRDAKEMYRDELSRDGLNGVSTFYGYYMLEAMSIANENQHALNTIRDYWGAMLDMGATSFWEDFNVAWTNNATRIDEMPVAGKKDIHGDFGQFCYSGFRHSLCHGWSSGPAVWCLNHILGFEILEPGCKVIRVKPFLGDLDWAEGSIATPFGPVRVRHEKNADGTIATSVNAPKEVKILK